MKGREVALRVVHQLWMKTWVFNYYYVTVGTDENFGFHGDKMG